MVLVGTETARWPPHSHVWWLSGGLWGLGLAGPATGASFSLLAGFPGYTHVESEVFQFPCGLSLPWKVEGWLAGFPEHQWSCRRFIRPKPRTGQCHHCAICFWLEPVTCQPRFIVEETVEAQIPENTVHRRVLWATRPGYAEALLCCILAPALLQISMLWG